MLDIVIIGAGAAGLAAARRLVDKGASFRLLEAKPHIGGRVVTDSATLGAPVDLGGHWLHSPALNPLTPLVDRYLFHVKQGPEDFRVARNRAILSGPEHDECFAYVDDCFAKIAAIGDGEHDCPASALFPVRGKWHDFFEANFIAKQGVTLAQSSALDFARYVWEGDDWPILDGFGALIVRHAQGIPVELETPATHIAWGGRNGVAVETPRGTIEARAVIIAVSTGVLANEVIRFSPSLPDRKQQAIADLPLGSCNKVALGFTRNPFGDVDSMMLMPDLGATESVEFVVREGGHNIVTAMLNGPFAKELAAQGARPTADYALTQLAAIFGNDVKACVTDRIVFADWDHDPWIRGCYAAAKPGRYAARAELGLPIEHRLFFAGEAVHHCYMGDVHGAHLTGEAAAEAALAALRGE
ncbi:flavin monoamine oxidase family protein [Dongia deserti]|uniref:flavin monoamine oxidase family protein n=1 Tax=Dongia deserti TaxID=2268030 RepID=UPI000E656226|nr:NAD(P)/FAD-dependent oxidoreductase [Dongia deserti]